MFLPNRIIDIHIRNILIHVLNFVECRYSYQLETMLINFSRTYASYDLIKAKYGINSRQEFICTNHQCMSLDHYIKQVQMNLMHTTYCCFVFHIIFTFLIRSFFASLMVYLIKEVQIK